MTETIGKMGAWCIIGITIYMLFMGLYPFKTIDVKQPATVLTAIVDAGDVLKYEVDYCKYTDAPAIITKTLISSDENPAPLNYTLISYSNDLPIGCGKFINDLPIPQYIQDGDYYVKISIEYRLNFLQTKTHEFRTESFYVFNPLPESPQDAFAGKRLALFN